MGDLQSFFEGTAGKVISIVVVAAIMILFLILARSDDSKNHGHDNTAGENRPGSTLITSNTHRSTMTLALSSMLIAASFVLSSITLFKLPQGGSVTPFSMLPIAICAYLLGTKYGVMAGTALGLINLIVNPYVIHPMQLLLDYPIAFGSLGIGGFMRNTKAGLPGVYLVGIFGRFVCSTLSGVIFFASYAEGTGLSPLLYSVIYNGTYMGAEGALTLIILFLPPVRHAVSRIKDQL